MILSNVKIVEAIENRHISINPIPHLTAGKAPFNTAAIDLTLGD